MNGNWLIQYPVWDLGYFGGGFWIALMATIHVYVAHFAVGGGFFLVLTEMKARREGSREGLEYVKKHTRFFLLLTAVFGALTGVGIWFVISVLSPAATDILIRNFLFAWATEWIFFLGEIVTLYIYYTGFDRMRPSHHLQAGWLYVIFGWLSLMMVNGIISYMLTPGDWIETRNVWDGFLNPSFLPSLVFRTAMSLMLAGLFGFVTAFAISGEDARDDMLRYCAKWLLYPLPVILLSGWWYVAALPGMTQTLVTAVSPETIRSLKIFVGLSAAIFVIGVLMAQRASLPLKKALAALLVVIGLGHMGAFEWVREAGRRPFLIHSHLYSNGVPAADLEAVQKAGFLKSARWARHREITDENRLDAGKELFKFLCLSCHSVGGPMNDIVPLTEPFSREGVETLLEGMGTVSEYMPPFPGNADERRALAAYLVLGLNGKKAPEPLPAFEPPRLKTEIPPFDPANDEFMLLAWTGKGMHCISDSDAFFSFAPPGSELYAMLIRRDAAPEAVTDGVTVTYEIEKPFRNPQDQVEFWKYASALTGQDMEPGTGPDGKKTADQMDLEAEKGVFTANVPVVPYPDGGGVMPYPMMTVTAKDQSGKTLAETRIPIPVSTEMQCFRCHGGSWRKDGISGISDETAKNILTVHDRLNRTDLLKKAENRNPVSCQSCHPGEDGDGLNLSAAIHGFHAAYLPERFADACAYCHPGKPDGVTRAFRGVHKQIGLDCMNCHGTMEDHALSLLTAEADAGKPAANRLMKHMNPRVITDKSAIAPRTPWVNAPDCLNCHADFQMPDTADSFNRWTASSDDLYRNRTAEGGILCAACHGAPHALYPARNPFGNHRDNIPPMQHQGNPYPVGADKGCRVCHTIDMETEMHHPNSLTMFRNAE